MNFSTEPSFNVRQFASIMWQTHIAFMAEGFTEEQAYELVQTVIMANGTA